MQDAQFLPQWLGALDVAPSPIALAQTQPLTRFERARVVEFRARQLQHGHMPRAHCADGSTNVVDVAAAELEAQQYPAIALLRSLPDGSHVEVPLSSVMPPPALRLA